MLDIKKYMHQDSIEPKPEPLKTYDITLRETRRFTFRTMAANEKEAKINFLNSQCIIIAKELLARVFDEVKEVENENL